jgi:arylsulfatase A-like enzyme
MIGAHDCFKKILAMKDFVAALLLIGLSFVATTAAIGQPPPDASPPNIVFIIADDLGWADVAFHGGEVPTPRLNRLRAEGVELTQHYVAPVCSPTRAGFMTGRYWSRFGVTTPTNELGLPMGTMTVAKALRDAGYATCLSGKWHLGSLPKWGPNHFGFDHAYGSLAGGVAPWNHRYKKGRYSVTWHRNGELLDEEGHVTDLLTDEVVGWLKTHFQERSDQPFFLYVPFTAVHLPIREPQTWVDRVSPEISGAVNRQYAACIMHLDHSVGRILDAIDQAGVANNTLFVFTSDNGGSTAENNDTKYPDDQCPSGRLPGDNRPLRGRKGTLYEGGIRVPTLVRWPDRLPAGSEQNYPAAVIDWMPTFCAAAAAEVDGERLKWDGQNLLPMLTGQSKPAERTLYFAGPRFKTVAIRKGRWKMIANEASRSNAELYDLQTDASETNNVAADHPEIVRELLSRWEELAASDRDAVAK